MFLIRPTGDIPVFGSAIAWRTAAHENKVDNINGIGDIHGEVFVDISAGIIRIGRRAIDKDIIYDIDRIRYIGIGIIIDIAAIHWAKRGYVCADIARQDNECIGRIG